MSVDLQVIGLMIAAVFAVMAYSAYRSNQKSDASWERMRRDLTPVMNPPRHIYQMPFNPSAYYSTAMRFDIIGTDYGHTHQIGYFPK